MGVVVPRRIAALTGAPATTVGYHLAVARAGDPGLEAAHEEAVAGKTLRVSAQGLARMQELVAMVHEAERYPSPRAGTAAERSLGVWLERRRREAAQGTLAAEYREGLGVLWGWQGATRAVSDEARWELCSALWLSPTPARADDALAHGSSHRVPPADSC
ncbi:hypothetical protein [Arthrobacter oryzae]|uniref:hypothetical protein n=1 Tax=Arthrobacter oryzae TaxID=409290 RepID=UPI0030C909C4